MNGVVLKPLIPLKSSPSPAKSRSSYLSVSTINTTRKFHPISASNQQEQLNLSVLRFTLGIPGFDESYLPRWIGYGFGSLTLLNHFVGSDVNTITAAQLRTEALGLCLAAFSVVLPYLGKFLKGAAPVDQTTLPEGIKQIFAMSENISDILKEDLAWATYILLRNTNTISVLISIQGALCVRGYWNTPDDVSKARVLEWVEREIEKIGLSDLKDTLYFPQSADSGVWGMLPKGTRSLLVQPVLQVPGQGADEMEKIDGFVLVASSIDYAYSDKDRAWIGAVANKFRGVNFKESIDFNHIDSEEYEEILKGFSLEIGKEHVVSCFKFPSTCLVQFQGSVGMHDYSTTNSNIEAFLEQYQHQSIDFIMLLLEKACEDDATTEKEN